MKPIYINFSVFLLVLFLTGCSEAPMHQVTPSQSAFQPTLTSTPIKINTKAPTKTASSTKTPDSPVTFSAPTKKPTLTPFPAVPYVQPGEGVKTEGPYLFYARQMPHYYDPEERDKPTILSVMDADASGQVVFTLPNQGYITHLSRAVSPDGQWVAYYVGTPQEPGSDGRYSFSLHLYQWKTGRDIKVADLLSEDYPKNFEKTAQFLRNTHAESYTDWENLERTLQEFFTHNVYDFDWSPDGRYLAFASERGGPSSDIYLYVLATGEVRRLTDGPAYIQWLTWTPDSQKIFHYSAYHGCSGECGTYHVVSLDGTAWDLEINSHGGVNIFTGWVSNNQMSMYSKSNGPRGPLRYVNINTGEDRVVFVDGVENASYNRESKQWIIQRGIDSQEDNGWQEDHSWFLLDIGTMETQLIDLPPYEHDLYSCYVSLLKNPQTPFVLACESKTVYFVHQDGSVTVPIDGEITFDTWSAFWGAISPDSQWLLANAFNEPGQSPAKEIGWFLFNSSGKNGNWNLEKQFSGDKPDKFFWRPDMRGFFYFVGKQRSRTRTNRLYYYSLENQQVILVDDQIELEQDLSSDWYVLWRP